MSTTNNNYCVILCGGIGSRLWPLSRKDMPKQFCNITGIGQSALQITYKRFARFLPEDHIYLSTYKEYVPIVSRQLPQVNSDHILAEPVQLGTAPALALATVLINAVNPKANIISSPCDQLIVGEDKFKKQILDGLDFVSKISAFLVLGVKPDHPDTSYGYIQAGSETIGSMAKVKSFTEKPDLDFARLFIESGEFYWNTSLFFYNASTMMAALRESYPAIMPLAQLAGQRVPRAELYQQIAEQYPRNRYQDVDMFVLEHQSNVYVQPVTFGWADIGTWETLYNARQKDNRGNVVMNGRAELYDSSNNILSMSNDKIIFTQDLNGYLVVESGNILLIAPKDNPDKLRRIMTDAIMKYGSE